MGISGNTAAVAEVAQQTIHVLVVEGEEFVRELYRAVLDEADGLAPDGYGAQIHGLASGAEAIGLATTMKSAGKRIACALIDFRLGTGSDGIETARRLWELEPDVQVTTITRERELGETRDRLPEEYLDQWDFLAKPVTPFELVQRTRRSLGAWFAHERDRRALEKLGNTVRERTQELADRNGELETRNSELEQALRDLEQAQSQLLQNEKMACIGVLAAGIAHDLNNPIGFVSSNLGTLQRYIEKIRTALQAYEQRVGDDPELAVLRKQLKLDFVMEDLPALVEESLEGTGRVTKIVMDLKTFSHPTENEARHTDINQGLESTLNIVNNELKYKAQVIRDFGDIPQVLCNPGQINQVFMNLLVNAAQAITDQGEIRISTRQDGTDVLIRISDTGSGIPESVIGKIFDPFFTTKEVGQGTGLGLSISFDIVRKHGGTIEVESRPDDGTTFVVRLPVDGSKEIRTGDE